MMMLEMGRRRFNFVFKRENEGYLWKFSVPHVSLMEQIRAIAFYLVDFYFNFVVKFYIQLLVVDLILFS